MNSLPTHVRHVSEDLAFYVCHCWGLAVLIAYSRGCGMLLPGLFFDAVYRQHDITPALCSLHWLPVSCRIQYKVSSLCHCSLSEGGPRYLSELLYKYTLSLSSASLIFWQLHASCANHKQKDFRRKFLLLHWPHSLKPSPVWHSLHKFYSFIQTGS